MDEDDEEVVVESSRPLVVVALELDKRKDGGGGSASARGPVLLFKEFLLAYLSGIDAIVTSRGYDDADVDVALIVVS